LLKSKSLFESPDYINIGDPGFIEFWDFSKTNLNHEARVQGVSAVASVCYGNNSLDPKFKLYDKLERESIGLPSSSFEFIPVLLDKVKIELIKNEWQNLKDIPHIERYGYYIDKDLLITNLRALIYDLDKIYKVRPNEIFKPNHEIWFNEKDDFEIIKNNFFVFRIKATIRDFRQHERHRRASYQELSRRYTTANKIPIEFRINSIVEEKNPGTVAFLEKSRELYEKILKSGIKAEQARDVLPVSMYSIVWTSYYPDGLENYLNLRCKSSAQREIKIIADTIKDFTGE